MSVVADKVELAVSGLFYGTSSLFLPVCVHVWALREKQNADILNFLFSPSKSKQHDSVCARSIQIPSGRRQNASGSECTSHPVARSISTFGPLEEDEKENQKISHIIPTGSLPATLQGPTVCSFSTLNVTVSSVQ